MARPLSHMLGLDPRHITRLHGINELAKGNIRFSVHLVQCLSSLFLLLASLYLLCVIPDLVDKVNEVAVSVWAIVWSCLLPLMKKFDCCLNAPDRREAEIEIQFGGLGSLLQTAQEPVSNSPCSNVDMKITYRCHKNQCLLQITKTDNFLLVDSPWAIANNWVKVFEGLFCQKRFQDVLMNPVA